MCRSAAGTALACLIRMNRWVGLLAVTMGGLLFAFPRAGEAPSAQQVTDKPAAQIEVQENLDPPAEPEPSVRVEHRLIQILPQSAPTFRQRPPIRAVNRRADSTRPAPDDIVARAR